MRNKRRHNRYLNIGLVLIIIALINYISDKAFFRLDLTSEKRYTVSDESKEILRSLEDIVFVRIYLDGDLNIPMQGFQKSIVELLDELKVYGRYNLDYELVDPLEGVEPSHHQNILNELGKKGLAPINTDKIIG